MQTLSKTLTLVAHEVLDMSHQLGEKAWLQLGVVNILHQKLDSLEGADKGTWKLL